MILTWKIEGTTHYSSSVMPGGINVYAKIEEAPRGMLDIVIIRDDEEVRREKDFFIDDAKRAAGVLIRLECVMLADEKSAEADELSRTASLLRHESERIMMASKPADVVEFGCVERAFVVSCESSPPELHLDECTIVVTMTPNGVVTTILAKAFDGSDFVGDFGMEVNLTPGGHSFSIKGHASKSKVSADANPFGAELSMTITRDSLAEKAQRAAVMSVASDGCGQ